MFQDAHTEKVFITKEQVLAIKKMSVVKDAFPIFYLQTSDPEFLLQILNLEDTVKKFLSVKKDQIKLKAKYGRTLFNNTSIDDSCKLVQKSNLKVDFTMTKNHPRLCSVVDDLLQDLIESSDEESNKDVDTDLLNYINFNTPDIDDLLHDAMNKTTNNTESTKKKTSTFVQKDTAATKLIRHPSNHVTSNTTIIRNRPIRSKPPSRAPHYSSASRKSVSTDDRRRRIVIGELEKALSEDVQGIEHSTTFNKIAEAIEKKIAEKYKDKLAYNNKYRSLRYNIQHNPELRASLIQGEITADRLVDMSTEEMANEKVKLYRQHRAKQFEQSIVKPNEPQPSTVYKNTRNGYVEVPNLPTLLH
jgi:hypothetical protein